MWRKKILPYFQYTRGERIGLLTLVVIIILLWVVPAFLASEEKPLSDLEIRIYSQFKDSLQMGSAESPVITGREQKKKEWGGSFSVPETSIRLYPFDPNTASEADWSNFGMKPKTISVIQNYLAKGGRFRQAEDLSKVYGLSTREYQRMLPYIRIRETKKEWEVKAYADREQQAKHLIYRDTYKKEIIPIEINTADSSQWDALPGIGMKLTGRILKFRKQLGGFHSIHQVAETFGLPDSVFQKIKPWLRLDDPTQIRKLLINKLSGQELDGHPYISGKLAGVIVAYRDSHGFFREPADLKKIALMTDELLDKITPYLDFSQ